MKKGFIIGLATGLTVAGASLVLANSQIQAILNDQIKVTLNGQVQEFKDETTNETQYPITYHDRTYLPLRTVANLVGVDVDYDANSNTAILKNENELNTNLPTNSNGILTENEALGLGSMMYKLANEVYSGHYVDLEGIIDKNPISENLADEIKFKVLNIDYFKEIFSESKFKKFVGIEKDNSDHEVGWITYEDGNYYFTNDAGGGPATFLGSELVVKNIASNKIEFDAITFVSENGFDERTVKDGDFINNNDMGIRYNRKPFVLVKENGKWKIDDFVHTYPENR